MINPVYLYFKNYIMNITKVFGFILALHFGVITVLFIQPGCRSTSIQPPTQSKYQANALDTEDLSTISSELESVYSDSSDASTSLSYKDLSAFNEIDGFSSGIAEDEALTVSVQEDNLDVHTIVYGDTLWDLAQRYDTTVNELCELNSIAKNATLQIGNTIEVPRVGDSIRSVSKESAAVYQPSDFEGRGQVYRVVSGDTLSKIAIRYDLTVAAIKATNSLTSDRILIGQELLIPVDSVVEVKAETSAVSNKSESVLEVKPVAISADTLAVEKQGLDNISADSGVKPEPSQTELIAAEPEAIEASESDTIINMDAMPKVEYRRVDSTTE
tara:strand:+ start:690 stop:1676 length:987 start_codon:yes stop_codon:yes gene_type:complete